MIQIAILLFCLLALGYLAFRDEDRWSRTFYMLLFGSILISTSGAPAIVGQISTSALAIYLVVWLWWWRSRPTADIGDRQTASATVEDDDLTLSAAKLRRDAARARLAEAKETGDYSKISDRIAKDAGLPVLELEHDTIQFFPGSTDILQVAKDGAVTVTAVHITHDLVKVVEEAGYTTTRVTS